MEQIFYPAGNNPWFNIAQRDRWLVNGEDDYNEPINHYGHLLSFTVRGGAQATRKTTNDLASYRFKHIKSLTTLSTHQQRGETSRLLAALPNNLIRLNIGAEHPLDIMADLDQARKG